MLLAADAPTWRVRGQLLALAAAAFVFVTSELEPVALLPQISAGLGVSEGSVGELLTAYAAVAGISAIPLTAACARAPRWRLIVATMLALVVSQLAAALAPNYAMLLAARLLCALAHGVFWSIVASVAASLLAPDRAGRATAVVFIGNSLALVLGTPLVTALGGLAGWRTAMAMVGAGGALVSIVLVAFARDAPPQARYSNPPIGKRAVRSALGDRSVLSLCAITLAVVLGHYTAFTYFVPIVRSHAAITAGTLSAVFLLYGAAGTAVAALIGPRIDRHLRRSIMSGCLLLMLAMALLATAGHSASLVIFAVLVWGATFAALPICLQSGVLRVAPHFPDAASSLYVVAFQIGIGAGALLGALLVNAHHLADLPRVALLLVASGTLLAAALRSRVASGSGPAS